MRMLTNSCAIVAVCLAATIARANAETFVLETGESFEGAIVRSVGGTVSIKLAAQGVRQLPLAHIRQIEVTIEGDDPIRGTLADWSNGTYEILSGDRLIQVRDGRILSDAAEPPAAGVRQGDAPLRAQVMLVDHRTWEPPPPDELQAMLQRIDLPTGEIAARINESSIEVRDWTAGKRSIGFGQWCKLRLLELTLAQEGQ